MNQFKAIESVRMRAKRAKRKKEMVEKIGPGRAWLGEKMDLYYIHPWPEWALLSMKTEPKISSFRPEIPGFDPRIFGIES